LNDAIDSDVESSVAKAGEAERSAQCWCKWPRRSWSTTEGVGETEFILHGIRILGSDPLSDPTCVVRRASGVGRTGDEEMDGLSFSPTPSVAQDRARRLENAPPALQT